MRMLGALALVLIGPFVVVLFPGPILSIVMTVALVGGVVYVAYALVEVVRAYRRWVVRRVARRHLGRVASLTAIGGLLIAGGLVGIVLLPAYLGYAALSGMTSAGTSPSSRRHDTISIAGLLALVIVVFLVVLAPLVGIAYLLLIAGLFWLHRTRLRIPGRAPSVGVGGLIDWLEFDAART